jgi:hypothetical protein
MRAMASPSKTVPVILVVVLGGLAAAGIYFQERRRAPSPVPEFVAADGPEAAPMKVLEAAERAFKAEFWETAMKFYQDFDLRHAGSKTYDLYSPWVWEQMKLCAQKMGRLEHETAKLTAERGALQERWLKAKAGTEAERKALWADLPQQDGRRAKLEAAPRPGP